MTVEFVHQRQRRNHAVCGVGVGSQHSEPARVTLAANLTKTNLDVHMILKPGRTVNVTRGLLVKNGGLISGSSADVAGSVFCDNQVVKTKCR